MWETASATKIIRITSGIKTGMWDEDHKNFGKLASAKPYLLQKCRHCKSQWNEFNHSHKNLHFVPNDIAGWRLRPSFFRLSWCLKELASRRERLVGLHSNPDTSPSPNTGLQDSERPKKIRHISCQTAIYRHAWFVNISTFFNLNIRNCEFNGGLMWT